MRTHTHLFLHVCIYVYMYIQKPPIHPFIRVKCNEREQTDANVFGDL